jgi:hypothetical protein
MRVGWNRAMLSRSGLTPCLGIAAQVIQSEIRLQVAVGVLSFFWFDNRNPKRCARSAHS